MFCLTGGLAVLGSNVILNLGILVHEWTSYQEVLMYEGQKKSTAPTGRRCRFRRMLQRLYQLLKFFDRLRID